MLGRITPRLTSLVRAVNVTVTRNIGISSVLCNKAQGKLEPIQQLFITKIKEYETKRKSAGGKLVDVTKEDEASLQDELSRIDRQYHASGQDMTQFPTLEFKDPAELQPLGIGVSIETGIKVNEADFEMDTKS